jgi:serine/threonine-protein kinase
MAMQINQNKSVDHGTVFEPGNVIQKKWVILDFIGKGAMGEVYRAHQLNLQRDVAIKVVSQKWLQSIDEDEEEVETSLQRFRREVQAMAQVRHPNVVQIYDHITTVIKKGTTEYPAEFITMEYIPGDTLRYTMSAEGFYPEQDLVKSWLKNYFLPVLDGVKAMHALDIVHRDLKPENILMDGEIPKIADFGLARSSRLRPVTQSMDVKGTAHYMSPEHFFDFRKADQRADIYSLGKILFEAVSGKIGEKTIPFKTADLENPETSFFQKLDKIIQDATAEKKEKRLDTVDKLRHKILEVLNRSDEKSASAAVLKPKPISFFYKPRWIWTGIATAIVFVIAMTIWHQLDQPGKLRLSTENPSTYENDSVSSDRSKISTQVQTAESPPAASILTEDGATLRYVSGGNVDLPENMAQAADRLIKVNPFYMDEAPVTNHQYVQFLNQNLSMLTVARGVVRSEDEIWLLLKEIFEEYEPIVFRKGKFHVSNAAYASLPVLRITAYGAAAYARFYNRRLPTVEEWLYAFGNNGKSEKVTPQHDSRTTDTMAMDKMHATMIQGQTEDNGAASKSLASRLVPVSALNSNKNGIRRMLDGFNEWSWLAMTPNVRRQSTDSDYVLMPEAVPRQPWEAFEEVGFRAVQDAARTLSIKK